MRLINITQEKIGCSDSYQAEISYSSNDVNEVRKLYFYLNQGITNFTILPKNIMMARKSGLSAATTLRDDLSKKATTTMDIEKVIFNGSATIVLWKDGTKTVVKAGNEIFDAEKGLAMAISKKVLGNKGNYYNTFRMHLEDAEVPMMKRPTKAEYTYAGIETLHEVLHHNKKATKAELLDAIDKAIGYLDKALED